VSNLENKPHAVKGFVVGASAGGNQALAELLGQLPADFFTPILVVQHLHPEDNGDFAVTLGFSCDLCVITPDDKEPILPGQVYVAPANYHMLIERNGTVALNTNEKHRWSRPSIDVLFESAAYAWGNRVVGILLSGNNDDGGRGLATIRSAGGLAIVVDPATTSYPRMPAAAIQKNAADEVLSIPEIASALLALHRTALSTTSQKTQHPAEERLLS
jgi:two-component system chemotaxis response regulator CheB